MSGQKKAAIEDLSYDGMLRLTPYDLGFSWCSPLPEPDEYSEDLFRAIESSFEAMRCFIEDHQKDPIKYYGYSDSLPANANDERVARGLARIMLVIKSGKNLGTLYDSTKAARTPNCIRRRSFYVWNQFEIHGAIKPGFFWFSDAQSARLLAGLHGFPVSEDDVKNDRRFYKIKKLPQKYLIDISGTLTKCEALRGLDRDRENGG